MKVSFITNICPHYRVVTFETLARYFDVSYLFYSAGDEWYWQLRHGVQSGRFNHRYLRGFRLGKTRVTPALPWHLWRDDADIYIKCVNGRFALPLTYIIARVRRKPFILWTGVWTRMKTLVHRLGFPITRHIYRHANAVVVYGQHVKRYLITEGVKPERIFVAPHAVDNEAYSRDETEHMIALREKLGIASDQKVVLSLGRLEPEKGVSFLIDAFASLNMENVVLVMAGNGSERACLEQRARAKGVAQRVLFPGYIPTHETMSYYALASVFVLPSVTSPTFKEPWGLVVNEAFNQGVPVIATEAVGAAAGGLVRHGRNGLIVPERDSNSLAKALHRTLEDASLRHAMGQRAREDIANWDNEQMVMGFRQAIDYVSDGLGG